MSSTGEFLLYPENRPFLDGREKVPRSLRPNRWGWLILVALSGALAVGLVVYFYLYFSPLWRLHAHGVPTEATVLQSESHTNDADQLVGQITYRFTIKEGNAKREFTRTYDFTGERAHDWRVGAKIKILYDPGQPEVSRSEDELTDTAEKETTAMIVVGTAGLLSLAFFGSWVTQHWLPMRRLQLHPGKVLTGEVTSCEGDNDEEGESLIVKYRFARPNGVATEGQSLPTFRAGFDRKQWPTPGTPVRVYYVDRRQFFLL